MYSSYIHVIVCNIIALTFTAITNNFCSAFHSPFQSYYNLNHLFDNYHSYVLCQGIYIMYLKAFSLAHNQLTVYTWVHTLASLCLGIIMYISSIAFISSCMDCTTTLPGATDKEQPHCVAESNEDGVFSFYAITPGQHSHWSVSLQQSGQRTSMYIGHI